MHPTKVVKRDRAAKAKEAEDCIEGFIILEKLLSKFSLFCFVFITEELHIETYHVPCFLLKGLHWRGACHHNQEEGFISSLGNTDSLGS